MGLGWRWSRRKPGVPMSWQTSQSVAADLHRRMHRALDRTRRTVGDARKRGVPTEAYDGMIDDLAATGRALDDQLVLASASPVPPAPQDLARPSVPHRRPRAHRRAHRPFRDRGSQPARRQRRRLDRARSTRASITSSRRRTSCASSAADRAPNTYVASACSARRRAMTRRHSVSSAPSKIESTRASTK